MRYLNITGINSKFKRNKEYDVVCRPSAVIFYLSVLDEIKRYGEDRFGFTAASLCSLASFKGMDGIILPKDLPKPFKKEDFVSSCKVIGLDIDFV